MYMPNPNDVIQAIDAVTGDLIWEHRRKIPDDASEYVGSFLSQNNRNIAIYGNLIIDTSVDDHIFALNGETGRATENPEVVFHALEEERLICPNMHGGKDWEAGAYSPETNTLYYPLRNMCMPTLTTTDPSASHTIYALSVRHEMAPGTDNLGAVYAISAETGRTVWLHEQRASTTSLVATGGGLSRKATMSMYSWALSVPGSSGGMVDRTLV